LGREVDIIKASLDVDVAFHFLVGINLGTLSKGPIVGAAEIEEAKQSLRVVALELHADTAHASGDTYYFWSESRMDPDR